MVNADLEYLAGLISAGLIFDPVLELGAGYGGATCRSAVEALQLRYFGTDLGLGTGVDFVADFEVETDMKAFRKVAPFGSILIFNVLEHTFDPIRVLDNARSLVRSGGTIVVLTPAIWPLHNYPMDAWRLLPNFYEEYAARRGVELLRDHFEYVGHGRVESHRNVDGSYSFPPPAKPGLRKAMSQVVHKSFNTFGRAMFQPSHIACGAVFRIRTSQCTSGSREPEVVRLASTSD